MSRHYGGIAFTDNVHDVQSSYGSDKFYGKRAKRATADPGSDALTPSEIEFLATRDQFYLSTVSETGWPYVQYRGGPPGFVHVVDDFTIGWVEFEGNLQYISTGNLGGSDRVAMIAVDYVRRQRLKIFGRARLITLEDDPALIRALTDERYDAVVQRAVLISVDAFDWNCPQHIAQRFSRSEVQQVVDPLRARIAELEQLNRDLRGDDPIE